MTVDKQLAEEATLEDAILLKAVHPYSSMLLRYAGKRWRLKRFPVLGIIISDAALIREVFLDKKNFSKQGPGASSSYWTPIIGESGLVNMEGEDHFLLKRNLSQMFTNKLSAEVTQQTISFVKERMTEQLNSGSYVDIVEEASFFAYRSLWDMIGLPYDRLGDEENFRTVVKTLRSVTHGLNLTKKKMSEKEIETAKAKLIFVEELTKQTYQNGDESSIPQILKQNGYSEEEAVSVVKALMITGTETAVSFLPRMAAIFIKTKYLDWLQEHPEDLEKGINEALRVTVPTPVAARVALNDVDFHGIHIKKGERIILSTIEASKRYGNFNPDQVLDKSIRGLWFGAGVHMCVGLPLAMKEAEEFTKILIEFNQTTPLKIVSQTSDDKGHTGAYKELHISW